MSKIDLEKISRDAKRELIELSRDKKRRKKRKKRKEIANKKFGCVEINDVEYRYKKHEGNGDDRYDRCYKRWSNEEDNECENH